MPAHTPGPWKINAQGELEIGGHSTGAEASDFSNGIQDYPEALANMKLAAAAPEMLDALKQVVLNAGDCQEYCVFQAIAERAIAKAEGR